MRTLGALVFPGFETLDYFGPIEMLGGLRDEIEVITVAKGNDPVPSVHGQRIVVDNVLTDKITSLPAASDKKGPDYQTPQLL